MSGTSPMNANDEFPYPGKLSASRMPERRLPKTGKTMDWNRRRLGFRAGHALLFESVSAASFFIIPNIRKSTPKSS
jgi:hypothetical protein